MLVSSTRYIYSNLSMFILQPEAIFKWLRYTSTRSYIFNAKWRKKCFFSFRCRSEQTDEPQLTITKQTTSKSCLQQIQILFLYIYIQSETKQKKIETESEILEISQFVYITKLEQENHQLFETNFDWWWRRQRQRRQRTVLSFSTCICSIWN